MLPDRHHSNMSQILKALLLASYSALIIHFLRTLYGNEEEIQITYITRQPNSYKKLMREIKQSRNLYTFMDTSFKMPVRLPTDLKYVLKWTMAWSHYSISNFVSGQKPFIDSNCTFYNCYMTNDRSLLVDPRYFDAILFDVENDWDYHPVVRAPHQKYIFTASEPSNTYQICHPAFNSYYNWSWTYKLDSNIAQPFFSIYYKNGTLAGPKVDMNWITSTQRISGMLKDRLLYKKKMAAWFVSHCKTKSGREKVAEGLAKALELYNFTLDIYGWCGKNVCPKENVEACLDMLEKDYYFYLAFENSMCEDYVSEKVLYALNHYTVPIVYGGANYSRFLPPGSYIDAKAMDVASLASLMIETSKNFKVYVTYFRWHKHYYYVGNPTASNVCKLCEMLNDSEQKPTQIDNFTKWWNTGEDVCVKEGKVSTITRPAQAQQRVG